MAIERLNGHANVYVGDSDEELQERCRADLAQALAAYPTARFAAVVLLPGGRFRLCAAADPADMHSAAVAILSALRSGPGLTAKGAESLDVALTALGGIVEPLVSLN